MPSHKKGSQKLSWAFAHDSNPIVGLSRRVKSTPSNNLDFPKGLKSRPGNSGQTPCNKSNGHAAKFVFPNTPIVKNPMLQTTLALEQENLKASTMATMKNLGITPSKLGFFDDQSKYPPRENMFLGTPYEDDFEDLLPKSKRLTHKDILFLVRQPPIFYDSPLSSDSEDSWESEIRQFVSEDTGPIAFKPVKIELPIIREEDVNAFVTSKIPDIVFSSDEENT